MSAQDPNDSKLMDVAAEQRLHKRRQRNRNQERKRIALKDLLARVTELDKTVLGTTGMSMETLQDIYHSISMEDMQFFWQHVPNICNPIKAELNTVSDAHRLERDRKKGDQFKKKLKRKLENGTISLEERNNLLQWHTRSNTTTDDSNNNDKGDKNAFSLLTMDRGRRKAWQIENFCHLLDQKLKKRSSCQQMTVVDFGCGSGNLCLALAAYFKTVHFVLVDKREYPLKLVERRAKEAGLTNIQVLQYTFSPQNLNNFEVKDQYGQFTTHFDVGIGLHCCGSFTDMVMTICLARGADCIVCPCCNGAMTSETTGGYTYPRSSYLRQYMSQDEYLGQLSKSADDLGHYPAKCLIEYDRALWAKENGFQGVDLLKLSPLESTPKHHVLCLKCNDD